MNRLKKISLHGLYARYPYFEDGRLYIDEIEWCLSVLDRYVPENDIQRELHSKIREHLETLIPKKRTENRNESVN